MSSYLAKKAAQSQAESLLAPLLEEDESSSDDDSDDSSASSAEVERRSPLEKLKSLVVYVGLGAGAVLSVSSMVYAPMAAIFVMGGVCVANVPYAVVKERAMGKLPTLRSVNNRLREEANRLRDEVDNLEYEVDTLEPEAERAFEVEEQLRDITGQQQANVDHFVELVKENEVIVKQMRENMRQRIVQDMITIVVKSDRDNDQKINRTEAKMLALSIRLALQEYNVVFDSVKFIRCIGEDASVGGVIEIVQKLMRKHGMADDEESITDSEYESEEEDDDEDDRFDMFHMKGHGLGGSCSGGVNYGATADGDVGVSLMRSDRRASHGRRSSLSRRLLGRPSAVRT